MSVISKPQRIIVTHLPVVMDNGAIRLFKAFRVQYNNFAGPYKGGIRFHPQVNLSEIQALAFWMMIKCAAYHLPFGGAKGGVVVNHKLLSKTECERLSRQYIRSFYENLGPTIDVPAPDMYTNPEIMEYMADEYGKLKGKKEPAVITGKPIHSGGSQGRDIATGLGAAIVLSQLSTRMKLAKNAKIIVQGFGNAGSVFSAHAEKMGYAIIGVSDSTSAIFSPKGLSAANLSLYKRQHGTFKGYPYAKPVSPSLFLTLPCDVLTPAALERQITSANAKKIQAKIIIEIANGPTDSSAEPILEKRHIAVVPDIIANAGGVIVSYFEWFQNIHGEIWSMNRVKNRLADTIKQTVDRVWDIAHTNKKSLRVSAYLLALKRLQDHFFRLQKTASQRKIHIK